MYRLSLVNMPLKPTRPFRPWRCCSSIQLVREELSEQVTSRVLHLNQDVAEHFGLEFYMIIADSSRSESVRPRRLALSQDRMLPET